MLPRPAAQVTALDVMGNSRSSWVRAFLQGRAVVLSGPSDAEVQPEKLLGDVCADM